MGRGMDVWTLRRRAETSRPTTLHPMMSLQRSPRGAESGALRKVFRVGPGLRRDQLHRQIEDDGIEGGAGGCKSDVL